MPVPKKLFITGHRGLVGSALCRLYEQREDWELILATHEVLDLVDCNATSEFIHETKPDAIIHAAGRVGGIHANQTHMAEFMYENLAMSQNIIHAAYKGGVAQLLFLGSSCIYPKMAPQPIREDALLSGPLESTNEGYALAKIAGIKLCEYYRRQYGVDFRSAMPCSLYGGNDNFDLSSGHVLPSLLRKFHEAKESRSSTVELWGTGKALREFLYVDDLADALAILLEQKHAPDLVNVGYGEDVSILELAQMIGDVVGYQGEIVFDKTMPDGTPRKLLDSSVMRDFGWRPKVPIKEGLKRVYQAFGMDILDLLY